MSEDTVKTEVVTENTPIEYTDYRPPVDIYENDGSMKIYMDMPGVSNENISVDVEDQILTVIGDSELKDEGRAVRFKRRFSISKEVNVSGIRAKIKDGVLEMVLPKAESAKVHKIKVSTE
jgi:HSP20 family molecular chaperone IbpA